jgi:hypothetical protein
MSMHQAGAAANSASSSRGIRNARMGRLLWGRGRVAARVTA